MVTYGTAPSSGAARSWLSRTWPGRVYAMVRLTACDGDKGRGRGQGALMTRNRTPTTSALVATQPCSTTVIMAAVALIGS